MVAEVSLQTPEASLVQDTLPTQPSAVEHVERGKRAEFRNEALNQRFDLARETLGRKAQESERAFGSFFRVSHLLKAVQKATTYEEGRSVLKDVSLMTTGAATLVGLTLAEEVRLLDYLLEESPNRFLQFGVLGAWSFLGLTRFKPRENVDWRVAGKIALRGVGLGATTFAVDQILKHTGLHLSSEHFVTVPLEYSVAKLATRSIASVLGISQTGDSLVRLITGKSRRSRKLTEHIYKSFINPDAEINDPFEQKYTEEVRFIDDLLQGDTGGLRFNPDVAVSAAQQLKSLEESLIVSMMMNPVRYKERWVKDKQGEIVKIDNLEVLEKVMQAEDKLLELCNIDFTSKKMHEAKNIILGKRKYRFEMWKRRFTNGLISTGLYGLIYAHSLVNFEALFDNLAHSKVEALRKVFGSDFVQRDLPNSAQHIKFLGRKYFNVLFGKSIDATPQEDLLSNIHPTERVEIVKPEDTLEHLMQGDVPLEDAAKLMIKSPGGGYGFPLKIVTPSGKELMSYSAAYISEKPPPDDVVQMVEITEGNIYDSPFKFFNNLFARNMFYFVRKLPIPGIHRDVAYSGASDPAIQLVEAIANFYNQPVLNPEHYSPLHDPSRYSFGYLLKLISASFRGKVPHELDSYFDMSRLSEPHQAATPLHIEELPNSTLKDRFNRVIDLFCGKFESYLAAQRIADIYGADEVLRVHSETVPMGGVVYGLPAASRFYFGENIESLPLWKKAWLVGSIQAPSVYLSENYKVKGAQRAMYVLESLKERGVIQSTDYVDAHKHLMAVIRDPRNVPVFNMNISNPQNTFDPEVMSEVPPNWQERVSELLKSYRENGPSGLPKGEYVFTENGIVVKLDAPDLPQFVDNPRHLERFVNMHYLLVKDEIPQQHLLLEEFQPLNVVDKGKRDVVELGDMRVDIPELNGHPAIAFVVSNGDEVVSEFDPTGVLAEYPTPPGSTIKPFMATFVEYWYQQHGELFDIMSTKIDDAPFDIERNMSVLNATESLNSRSPDNQLTLAEAIAHSANVPFMREWRKILARDPDAFSKMQDFLNKNFGIYFTDIYGEELTKPTPYVAIGSDAYIPSLERYAQAYSLIADPSKVQDPDVRVIVEKVNGVLGDYQKKQVNPMGGHTWGEFLRFFEGIHAKTGTVPLSMKQNLNSDLLAVGWKDSHKVVIVRINNGDSPGIHRFASQKALPILRHIIDKLDPVQIPKKLPEPVDTNNVAEFIGSVISEHAASNGFESYSPVFVPHATHLLDTTGHAVMDIPARSVVDFTGKVVRGTNGHDLAEVIIGTHHEMVLGDRYMESMRTVSGYVPADSINKNVIPHLVNPELDEMLSHIGSMTGDLPGKPLLVVLDGNEKSPALYALYQSLARRNMFAATYEDFGTAFKELGLSKDTSRPIIVVNGDMLDKYLQLGREGDVVKILEYETEHIKQMKLLKTALGDKFLDHIFWNGDKATHSQRLLEIFADGLNRFDTNQQHDAERVISALEYQWWDERPEKPERLLKMYSLYRDLMAQINSGQSIDQKKARELFNMLDEFNKTPLTDLEKKILGISE